MQSNPHIVDAEQLRKLSGKKTSAAVRRWASSQGIRVRDSDEGPWTTLEALNAALGVSSGAANDTAYGHDIL